MTILLLSLMTSFLQASTTPQRNAAKLALLQQNRVGTIWTCVKDHNKEAVVMFKVNDQGAGLVSSDKVFSIQDQQICDALRVTCPYVGRVDTFAGHHEHYSYWSTQGKYEDSVGFFSDNGGMKIASSQDQALNWYFHPGECILH